MSVLSRKGLGLTFSALVCIFRVSVMVEGADRPRYLYPTLSQSIEASLGADDAERLGALSDLAWAESWQKLAEDSAALGRDLAEENVTDPAPYAVIAAYQAIAAAALGNASDARWYWQVGLNLLPHADRQELSAAFEIAPDLISLERPALRTSGCPEGDLKFRLKDLRDRTGFSVGQHKVDRKTYYFSASGVVGEDGRPHSPRLRVAAEDVGGDVAYAYLEGMRRQRFEPARKDGVPIECPYGINIPVAGFVPRH